MTGFISIELRHMYQRNPKRHIDKSHSQNENKKKEYKSYHRK